MPSLGHVLTSQSLRDAGAVQQAFKTIVDTSRFDYFVARIYNTGQCVQWEIRLLLIEGLFEGTWQQPPGYVQNTGVILAGDQILPGQSQTTYLPSHIKCQATRIRSSVQWVRSDGYEPPVQTLPDQVAKLGVYFVWSGWKWCAPPDLKSESKETPPQIQFTGLTHKP
jgi:hypothetical protein